MRKTINSAALLSRASIYQDQPAVLNQRGDTHSKVEQKRTGKSVREANNNDMKQYVGRRSTCTARGSDIF